jgi:hypothetical protein
MLRGLKLIRCFLLTVNGNRLEDPTPEGCRAFFIPVMMMMMMVRVIIIIMSLGQDHVSEVWLPANLLFIPQVIHEHGKPWRNYIDRPKLQIHQPELSGILTNRTS